MPTSSDDVIFDANSLSTNSVLTFDLTNSYSKSFNSSALGFNLTTAAVPGVSPVLNISGDINLSRTTFTFSLGVVVTNGSTSNITQNASSISRLSLFGDGAIILQSNITASQIIIGGSPGNRTFDTNGYNLTLSSLSFYDNTTVDISGSIIGLTSWYITAGATSLNASGSTINISGSFTSGGTRTYGEVNFTSGGTSNISGSNTFASLSTSNNKSLIFGINTTQTILGSFTIGSNNTFVTDSGGTSLHYLVKSSGAVNAVGIKLKGSRASGGAGWFADNTSTDNGYNSGWVFAPPPPVANFSGSPLSGTRPLTVNFTDTSSNGPTTWAWDFTNDGSTDSTSQNPSNTYSLPGVYSVKLTATNSQGNNSVTKNNYITVLSVTFNREAKGTIVLGGFANRKHQTQREAKGTIVLGGSANGFIRKETDSIENKVIYYKVYDQDGTYLETWHEDVINEPSFSQEINEIGSTLDIELARNSDSLATSTGPLQTEAGATITTEDSFPILATLESREQVGPGSSVNHNNRVDVWVYYGGVEPLYTEDGEEILTEAGDPLLATLGAPNGRRIFTGFISDISSRYGGTETTLVQLSSFGYDLDQYPITDGTGKTKVTFNSYDPSNIAKEAIDQFVEDATTDIGGQYEVYTTRSSTSISNTGTVVSYPFNNNTYADVLKKVLELMPSNWYFYVGLGDNTVYYRERSSEPQHKFYLGRHIKELDLRSYIGDSENRVLFTGGEVTAGVNLYKDYKQTPTNRTRRRLYQYSDQRVELAGSAQILSEGRMDGKNKVQYRTTVDILTKQYDIESIMVGDMVGFRNFGNYVDDLMLQVVARTYTPDVVTLQLDSITPSVNKRLEDLKRNLTVSDNQFTPDEPT